MLDSPTKPGYDRPRLLYDFFKHLTTLDTASILIALTLLEKFLPKAEDSRQLMWIFGGFTASMVCSLITMFFLINLHADSEVPVSIGMFVFAAFLVGILGFLLGLLALVEHLRGTLHLWEWQKLV